MDANEANDVEYCLLLAAPGFPLRRLRRHPRPAGAKAEDSQSGHASSAADAYVEDADGQWWIEAERATGAVGCVLWFLFCLGNSEL